MELAGSENDLLNLLPPDVPSESLAHKRVKLTTRPGVNQDFFRFTVDATTVQVTVAKCGGHVEVAARIGRLCYVMLENGASKEDAFEYRNSLYKVLQDGKPLSLPTPSAQPVEAERDVAISNSKRTVESDIQNGTTLDDGEKTESIDNTNKRQRIETDPLKEFRWENWLPEEVPEGHAAHTQVRYQPNRDTFRFKASEAKDDYMNIIVPLSGRSMEAAGRVGRLCYAKQESGASREEVLEYRGALYRKLQYGLWKAEEAKYELPSETDGVDWSALLPADAPEEHEAYLKVTYQGGNNLYSFRRDGVLFQIGMPKAKGIRGAAARIGRLCYLKMEEGASKEEATDYRNSLFKILDDGKPLSLPTPSSQPVEGESRREESKSKGTAENVMQNVTILDAGGKAESVNQRIEGDLPKEFRWQDLLPEELPEDHAAHTQVRYQPAGDFFRFRAGETKEDAVDVLSSLSGKSTEAAGRVGRLCYARHESGASREEVLEYRGALYRKLQYSLWKVEKAKDELPSETDGVDWSALLPADAPEEHEAYMKVFHQSVNNLYKFTKDGVFFQVTVPKAKGIRGAAARICRLCYMKIEEGASKDEATDYRNSLFKILDDGKPLSLPTPSPHPTDGESKTGETKTRKTAQNDTKRTQIPDAEEGIESVKHVSKRQKIEHDLPKEWEDALPEDAPPDSLAHERVKLRKREGCNQDYFNFKIDGTVFQVTVAKCGGNVEAAARIGRLCFVMMESGVSKEEVTDYRNSLYKALEEGKPISLPTPNHQPVEAGRSKTKRIGENEIQNATIPDGGNKTESENNVNKRQRIEEDLPKEFRWEDLLPEEVPEDHAAHTQVKYLPSGDCFRFASIEAKDDFVHVTTRQSGRSMEAAGRLARLCYVKQESGASRQEVLEYRDALYRKLQYGLWKVEDAKYEIPSEADVVDWSELLPADAPDEHEAYLRVNFQSGKNLYIFFRSKDERFQVTVAKARGIRGAAARICRLCYLKMEDGSTKEDTIEYRNSLFDVLAQASSSSAQRSSQVPKQGKEGATNMVDKERKAPKDKKEKKRGKSRERKKHKKEKDMKEDIKEEVKDEIKQEVKEEVKEESEESKESSDKSESSSSSSSESSSEDAKATGTAVSQPSSSSLPSEPRKAVAKLAVRTGLRCFCHFALKCPGTNGHKLTS